MQAGGVVRRNTHAIAGGFCLRGDGACTCLSGLRQGFEQLRQGTPWTGPIGGRLLKPCSLGISPRLLPPPVLPIPSRGALATHLHRLTACSGRIQSPSPYTNVTGTDNSCSRRSSGACAHAPGASRLRVRRRLGVVVTCPIAIDRDGGGGGGGSGGALL
eukprot:360255-Chlamydomonas_euryale.AAC.9